jgi:hypothetical protein
MDDARPSQLLLTTPLMISPKNEQGKAAGSYPALSVSAREIQIPSVSAIRDIFCFGKLVEKRFG